MFLLKHGLTELVAQYRLPVDIRMFPRFYRATQKFKSDKVKSTEYISVSNK